MSRLILTALLLASLALGLLTRPKAPVANLCAFKGPSINCLEPASYHQLVSR